MAESDEQAGSATTEVRVLTWVLLGGVFLGVLALFSVRCAHGPETTRDYPSRTLPPEPAPELAAWYGASESFYFPCSDCHEDEPTYRAERTLEFEHEDLELAHGDLWCLHCHEADDRDRLHLADETSIDFEESWRLCTQCHGEKLADWRAGVHGRRLGHWWGPKEYRTCVSCHEPHTPAFPGLEPRPPPVRPGRIGLQAAASAAEAAQPGEDHDE